MTDRREPPFLDEDGAGSAGGAALFRLPRCESMELLIETLTGTRFQLRVSPFHTVLSLKARIHRLEGIPVAQQHLIWNNVELEDEYCLYDYSISEGSTLKLVLAMRGGPINTRRVAVDDSLKEMVECMEGGQGGAWEEAPPHAQVTYLVYREGEQLNFFRVADRGDGTLTPVRGSSVYNLHAEEEELGDSGAGQQALENSITMSKMRLLRAKMENMNLNKKPKQSGRLRPRPPGEARTCGGYVAPNRLHRPLRVLPPIGRAPAPGSGHLPRPSLPGPAPGDGASREPEGEEPREKCPALGEVLPPPEVSRPEVGGSESEPLKELPVPPPFSALATRGLPGALTDPQKALSLRKKTPYHVTFDLPSREVSRGNSLAAVAEQLSAVSLLAVDRWVAGEYGASTETELSPSLSAAPSPAPYPLTSLSPTPHPLTSLSPAPHPPTSLSPAPNLPTNLSVAPSPAPPTSTSLSPAPNLPNNLSVAPSPAPSTSTSLSPAPHLPISLSATISPTPHPPNSPIPAAPCRRPSPSPAPRRPPSPALLRPVRADSPDVWPAPLSQSEGRDVPRMAPRVPSSPLPLSQSRRRSRGGGVPPRGRSRGGASIRLIREDLLLSPTFTSVDPSVGGSPGVCELLPSTSTQSPDAPTPPFPLPLPPPVKGPPGSRKRSYRRCYVCRRKTGLASSFQCRCGRSFCTSHRYAEMHACSFDYKSTGRRLLQETSPVVTAPKLPKI